MRDIFTMVSGHQKLNQRHQKGKDVKGILQVILNPLIVLQTRKPMRKEYPSKMLVRETTASSFQGITLHISLHS